MDHGSEDNIVKMAIKYLHATQTQHVPNGTQLFFHICTFSSVACLWNWCTRCPYDQARKSLLAPSSKSLITKVLLLIIPSLMPFPSVFLSVTNQPHCSNSLLLGFLASLIFQAPASKSDPVTSLPKLPWTYLKAYKACRSGQASVYLAFPFPLFSCAQATSQHPQTCLELLPHVFPQVVLSVIQQSGLLLSREAFSEPEARWGSLKCT